MRSREPAGLPQSSPIAASSLLLLALAGCGGEGSGFQLPPTTGTLQVTTTTAGDEPDPDGYTFQLDGEAPQPIGAAATTALSELEPGDHTMRLDGLAPNCSVAENPRSVRIDAGQTTTSTFAVACSATSGGVVITTVTTGDTPDPDGFSVVLDGVDQGPIPVNGQLSLTGLALGSHVVGLSGLAGNCSLQGDNLRAVAVTPGSSAPVDYAITCTAPPANAGTLRVITVTTGDSPDADGYSFSLDRGDNQPIGANATATITNLAAGAHRVQLSGLSDNCRVQGDNPRPVNVPGDGSNDLTFNVSCTRPVGSIRVIVATTGSPADPNGYQVTLDGGAGQHVDADGSLRFDDVAVGSHAITLTDIAENCSVTEGPSRQVAVTTGRIADVRLAVTCTVLSPETGSIQVITSTFGEDQDTDGYDFSVDGGEARPIGPDGNVTVDNVLPGERTVELTGIAPNCSVEESNPQPVTVNAGESATARFTLECSPTTGSIRVAASTEGGNPDTDGYDVTVDGNEIGHVASNGDVIVVDGLEPGPHSVLLSGLADNCQVQGDNPRSVPVAAGESENADFQILCSAPAVNTSPNAENDAYSTSLGTRLQVSGLDGLLANDSDMDGDNLRTVPETKSTREQGNVMIGEDGSFDYTPAESFTGPDSFEYTVTDGRGGESTGVVTIQVNP